MISERMLSVLRGMLGDDADSFSDSLLEFYLEDAGNAILNKLYSITGYADGTPVPAEYHTLQIKIALVNINKSGVEGETSHTENGIRRDYGTVDSLLKGVMPYCTGVVRRSGSSTDACNGYKTFMVGAE